jgi:DNA repair protein RadD
MIVLRDYQNRAIKDVYARLRDGIRRVILQSPTGSGKTIMAVVLILASIRQGKRVLFAAHRVELLDQTFAKLIAIGLDESMIGVVRGGDRRAKPDAPIQVASIASLRDLPPADLVIIDEAHRSSAASYKKLFESYPSAIFVGLTATPERLDGRPLDMYQEIVVVAQPRELAMAGHIMSPIVYSIDPKDMPDLAGVQRSGGDYKRGQLAVAVNKRKLVGDIVAHWQQRTEGLATIVSAVNIKHSKAICQAFLDQNIPAEHADGKMQREERRALIHRVETGQTLVVTQVDLFTEGVDLPIMKCSIQARPTDSLMVYMQSIGRTSRPYNGIISVVLDHVGNARVHGHPMEPRQYSLVGKRRRPKEAQIAKMCECFAMNPVDAEVCEACGQKFGKEEGMGAGRSIRTQDGFLVELPQDEASIRQQFWSRTAREANQMGFKREWVAYKFESKFGQWPPDSYVLPEKPVVDDTTRRKELDKLRAIAQRNGMGQGWALERYQARFDETAGELLERETLKRKPPSVVEEIDVGL